MQVTAIDGSTHNLNPTTICLVSEALPGDTGVIMRIYGCEVVPVVVAGTAASFVPTLPNTHLFIPLNLYPRSTAVWVLAPSVHSVWYTSPQPYTVITIGLVNRQFQIQQGLAAIVSAVNALGGAL
jgi:hypothetical protein